MNFKLIVKNEELKNLLKIFNTKFNMFKYSIIKEEEGKTHVTVESSTATQEDSAELIEVLFEDLVTEVEIIETIN